MADLVRPDHDGVRGPGARLPGVRVGRALFRSARELGARCCSGAAGSRSSTRRSACSRRHGPRLHFQLYGFHQHSPRRAPGGYRPLVFMSHGIVLAASCRRAAVALVAVAGSARSVRASPGTSRGCSSRPGAWARSCSGSLHPAHALREREDRRAPRQWLPSSAYPLLRGADVFPTETFVGWAGRDHCERADLLPAASSRRTPLERARERLLFGWGAYKRPRIRRDRRGKR